MRKRIPLGDLKPDLPPADHLVTAKNTYPATTGYTQVKEFQALTPTLAGISGGAAFVSSGGEASFLGGDATSLYRYSNLNWAPVLTGQTAARWRFAQFGDNIIAANGGSPVSYSATAGTAALLAGSPPAADMVATVRDFVVLAGDPNAILTVTWSAFNDSTGWSPTDNQSDSQQMLDGGEVMGLAGGEYGVILQKNAIKRMTYVGPEVIFQFDEISSNVGCMAKGSVAQTGRQVFFLSERGFMVCDGNDVTPIGAEKIDRTFFTTYSRQDIEAGIYAAVDPARNVVMWSMPGNPGTLWCYHWTLGKWATIETDVSLIFSGFTANISTDAIDTLYGNLDAIPLSLDDPLFSGGNPLLLIANTAGTVGTLSGQPLPATFICCRMELADGRTRVRSVRPITDASDVIVTIQGRARSSNVPLVEQSAGMRANGSVPIRVNAREIVTSLTTSGPWSYFQGFDLDYEDGGQR